ncbi:hypothetical protein [Lentzea sp. NBRC 105346]|uniref:hypothetical protein n=1 Tax=Lentzea sp. NBRC 105346 TaxID=3032205 RepID=UPI002554ED5F|nr:hypothetical protein [Lentzea sp. NBRC 105346]
MLFEDGCQRRNQPRRILPCDGQQRRLVAFLRDGAYRFQFAGQFLPQDGFQDAVRHEGDPDSVVGANESIGFNSLASPVVDVVLC